MTPSRAIAQYSSPFSFLPTLVLSGNASQAARKVPSQKVGGQVELTNIALKVREFSWCIILAKLSLPIRWEMRTILFDPGVWEEI